MNIARKNDLLHLMIILQSVGKILRYAEVSSDADDFYYGYNQMAYNASLALLMRIKRRMRRLSLYKNTPDQELRNILCNINNVIQNAISDDIIEADHHKVYKIIQDELPEFKEVIEDTIRKNIALKFFDINELYVCQGNEYYNCVDFDNFM